MGPDARPLTLENIPDAIHVINESSRGTSLEFAVDFAGFLWLSRYWNFSYQHSVIGYVEAEPASLILNCADPDMQDAYTFYWGTVPKFRTSRISLSLAEVCGQLLHNDGYATWYADTLAERPPERYRFVHFHPVGGLASMEAESLVLPPIDPDYEVRRIEVDDLFRIPPDQPVHWCQRHSFLRNAAPFLEFSGAFTRGILQAYLVMGVTSPKTTLLDLRCRDGKVAAGNQLLRWLVHSHRPPFTAQFLPTASYAHTLLTAAGFGVTGSRFQICRDLRATCSRHAEL